MRRKLTPAQRKLHRRYSAQVSRLKRLEKSLLERGYIIPPITENIKKPKRVTEASIRKLQKITAKSIYNKADYVTEFGDVVSGYQGQKLEREARIRAKKKRDRTGGRGITPTHPEYDLIKAKIIYDNFMAYLREIPERLRHMIQRTLYFYEYNYSREDLILAIGSIGDALYFVGEGGFTSDEIVDKYDSLIANHLPHLTDEQRQELLDELDRLSY